jgi:hypothetical protein
MCVGSRLEESPSTRSQALRIHIESNFESHHRITNSYLPTREARIHMNNQKNYKAFKTS